MGAIDRTPAKGRGAEDTGVRIHRRLWQHWGTPAGIYGTILYASVIAASSVGNDDAGSAVEILVFSLVSIVVFWLAHVYSDALGFHGDADRLGDRMRDSLRYAVAESSGMLEAAVIPSVPLLLGSLGIVPSEVGVGLALWLCVLMLALLGFLVFLVRGRSLWVCLVGAVVTGLFGVVVIILKTTLSH